MQTRAASLFLALCAASAACKDSTAPVIDNTLESVLALAASTQEYDQPAFYETGAFRLPTAGVAVGGCVYNSGTQFFVCPAYSTFPGVAVNQSFQLLDAGGATLSAFDTKTVSGIRTVTNENGTLSFSTTLPAPANISIQYDRHTDYTITSLRSPSRTLTGTSTLTSVTTTNGVIGATTSSVTTADELMLQVLPSDTTKTRPLPTSGNVTVNATLPALTGAGTRTMTVVVDYDGTKIIRMLISGTGLVTRSLACDLIIVGRNATLGCSS